MKTNLLFRIRVFLADKLIVLGLIVLPESRYKKDLVKLIYGFKDEVIRIVNEQKNKEQL